MMSIEIRPVRTARERRTFLTFPWHIYKNDPLWVPPLLPERARLIDPKRGAFFKRGGEAEFFIAWRDGKPVGTICAAEDRATNEARGMQECVFGFFEYIEDYEVFEALLNCVAEWARPRGLNAFYGPFNLDYEDSYGVLVEGRDRPPALLCGHTPLYYQGFMERFGFQPARGDNIALYIDIDKDTPALQRLSRLAEKVRQKGTFVVREADLTHWDDEVDRIHHLLNVALAHLPDSSGWHREAVESLVAPFRDIADPELVLFADAAGETVGWLAGIANLNEVFARVDGLRYPWNYVPLLWYMRRQTESLTIKSVLVVPDYWRTGVAVVLFDEMAKRTRAKGYKWIDLSITSEENPQTPLIGEHMGAKIYKRWRVYRLSI
ncbi:MAG: GNAT family N-acetyltransferase [Anaerolineae bacterium]|nr:GNAT family N-acetyltransferase [Anaerolineae bacterium]